MTGDRAVPGPPRPRRFARTARSRFQLHLGHQLADLLRPLVKGVLPHRPRMWVIPRLPISWHPSRRAERTPWEPLDLEVPEALLRQPGVGLVPDEQERAARLQPLHDFFLVHTQIKTADSPTSFMWPSMLSVAPRMFGAVRRRMREPVAARRAREPAVDPVALTAALRAESRRLGISAIGVTAYDEKFNYADYRGRAVGETVVVAILEQNFESTQLIPSIRGEKAALSTYAELEGKMVDLARWIRDRGYPARAEGFAGESMVIPYAVAAGLGQLGLNGQLLTPHAGSRVRIHVLTTSAPLVHDAPRDFGLEGVCDECKICVARCPAGAIPAVRREHRGVVKAKLNTKRCLPVVGKAAGCSVCMKVCPVQRYGLPAVLDHFAETGRILGKGTDDLEGYDWPVDGKHYPPDVKPRLTQEFLQVEGFEFDPAKLVPSPADRPADGGTALSDQDPIGY